MINECQSVVFRCSSAAVVINRIKCTFYRPQRRCGKVMFLHLSVILFTRVVCLPHHPLDQRQTPPLGRHPSGQTPPAQCMLGYTPLPSACWDTHIPAQCIPRYTPLFPVHAGIHIPPAQYMLGYGQQAGGTHPTGMHSWVLIISLPASLKRLNFIS